MQSMKPTAYNWIRLYLAIPLIFILTACEQDERISIHVDNVRAWVAVASDQESRTTGLVGRQRLASDEGLLMVFPQEKTLKVWMLNMSIPIDVGYFDKNGMLLNTHSLEPDSGLATYASEGPAVYALELNKGWFKRHAIEKSAKLHLPYPIHATD